MGEKLIMVYPFFVYTTSKKIIGTINKKSNYLFTVKNTVTGEQLISSNLSLGDIKNFFGEEWN